jgi:hypothetical protein
MAMKEDVPGASLTDGRQITQLLLTGNEPGNALEKEDGNPSKKERPDRSGLFRFSVKILLIVFLNSYRTDFLKLRPQHSHILFHLQIKESSP